jgi:uncharacterized repeat protein (TIGR02543 family)
VSDDFNTCSLDTGLWTFIDPLADATQAMTGTYTEDAWLSISVPAGTSHDIWTSGNLAPRIIQPADNTDFEVEVKFESGVRWPYQMQGVLVEQDSDDFLRFEFYGDGVNTRVYAASFRNGNPLQKVNNTITTTNVAPLYMRVRRQGDVWTQSYSYDGTSWRDTDPITFTRALTVTTVGTYAANAGSNPPAHTGYIDYFFNTASPIVPEDEARNSLTVNVVGSGSVVTDPVKASYGCSEVVTLTATAEPGWTFAGWSGDLSGADSPTTVTMNGSRVITATFTPEEYTLTVNIVGNGSVARDPDQAAYHYGDVVTLTATRDPGWTFDGWSGALSGNDNPETITITGDTSVTATFIQEEYTLTVNTVGNGSVAKDPDQATYHYGDEVTLTATGGGGWTFSSWSGDLSGSDNPETVTITGDTIVTATFTRDEYNLTVNVIGNGSVAKDPDQATYHYGDEVTLTATASYAWAFAGWSGDLSGTDNPETITITGHTTVTATFTPTEVYTLTVDCVGSGRVDKNPDKGTQYHYGDAVTLTAVPDPGWGFVGWSGDLSGSDNPETLTVTRSTTITATFTTYQVFLPLMTRNLQVSASRR